MLNFWKDGECWYWLILQNFSVSSRRVTRGEDIFWKLEKSTPILEKNALIVAMYGLHFSCGFKSFQEKKKIFYPAGPFFHALLIKCLSKCSNFKKTPLPRKSLVTRLRSHNNYEIVNPEDSVWGRKFEINFSFFMQSHRFCLLLSLSAISFI